MCSITSPTIRFDENDDETGHGQEPGGNHTTLMNLKKIIEKLL